MLPPRKIRGLPFDLPGWQMNFEEIVEETTWGVIERKNWIATPKLYRDIKAMVRKELAPMYHANGTRK